MEETPQAPPLPPDARELRASGRLAGTRPLEPLTPGPLEIKSPDLKTAPRGPVDAVIVLGMGPVAPVLTGDPDHREPRIGLSRMRNNIIAARELAASGLVNRDGLIVVSGTSTANPVAVEAAIAGKSASREAFVDSLGPEAAALTPQQIDEKWRAQLFREAPKDAQLTTIHAPNSAEDAEQLYTTSEAQLMADLYEKARPKSGSAEDAKREVFVDDKATESVDNYIYALNKLDADSRAKNGQLFDGSIAVITSRHHIARAMDTARFLGIDDKLVPLVSQQVLTHAGYKADKLLDEASQKFDTEVRWGEQKWIRTLHQFPAYALPMLAQITDNERFIHTLEHMKDYYGEEVLRTFGLENFTQDNSAALRTQLSSIIRVNPREDEWLKTDTTEVNEATKNSVAFTEDWLTQNAAPALQTA